MNKIINNFLLTADKFMAEIYFGILGLLIVLASHLLKTEKEFKNLKKQEIQDIFIKMN